jgi:hypothetical protein
MGEGLHLYQLRALVRFRNRRSPPASTRTSSPTTLLYLDRPRRHLCICIVRASRPHHRQPAEETQGAAPSRRVPGTGALSRHRRPPRPHSPPPSRSTTICWRPWMATQPGCPNKSRIFLPKLIMAKGIFLPRLFPNHACMYIDLSWAINHLLAHAS